MTKQIEVTLNKSLIGRLPKHKQIANQLGLRKIGHTVVHAMNDPIKGLISKISYLVTTREL